MSSHIENNHVKNNHVHTEFNASAEKQNNRATHSKSQGDAAGQNQNTHALPAGQWLRAVLGFEAPFGHDGLPTVWG